MGVRKEKECAKRERRAGWVLALFWIRGIIGSLTGEYRSRERQRKPARKKKEAS